ncbi:MAG: response regulator transcription factor [Acidimicrobiales bacterium]
MDRIEVLVADPQFLVADALGQALAGHAGLAVVEEHPITGLDAVESVVRRKPDVAVLDYWLPGTHGPAAVQAIRGWLPRQRIIVLSAVSGPEQIRACLGAGAAGFLPKSVPVELLADGVRRAHAGESPVFRDRLERMVAELSRRCRDQDVRVERLLSLTPRELAVLQELSRGAGIVDVARSLTIRPGTVRSHIHSILSKTGAHSQLEAVAMAYRERLIGND